MRRSWSRIGCGLATAVLGVQLLSAPASASHIDQIVVSQTGSYGLAVTIKVDLYFTGQPDGGYFEWTTGDGGYAYVDDGIVGGAYAGDASGTGSISGSRPAGQDMYTFQWSRSQPASNNARTMITYNYAQPGAYTVDWYDCCTPDGVETTGTLVVVVSAAPDPDAAYCDYAQAGGRAYYSLPGGGTRGLTLVPRAVHTRIELKFQCTGTGHDSGGYSLTLNFDGLLEDCLTASTLSNGTITGTTPAGPVTSGSITGGLLGLNVVHRVLVHYYLTGSYQAGGHEHSVIFWLDYVPDNPDKDCWVVEMFSAGIIGHGAVTST